MGQGGDRTDSSPRRRRRALWAVAMCAGLVVGQPVATNAQTGGGLPPSIRDQICQVLRSTQSRLTSFPGVAGIFTGLLQSFGCSGGPAGTTTTTTFGPTTTTPPTGPTTTVVPPSTVVGPTSSTTPTTLPPCIPNNPVSTTVPCVPITTLPST